MTEKRPKLRISYSKKKKIIKGHAYFRARVTFPYNEQTGVQEPERNFYAKTKHELEAKVDKFVDDWKQNPQADTKATFGVYLKNEFIPYEESRTELPTTSKRHLSWAKFMERKSRMLKLLEQSEAKSLCGTLVADLTPGQFKKYLEHQEAKLSASKYNKLRQDLKLALKGLLGRVRLPVSEFYLYLPEPAVEHRKDKTLPSVDGLLEKIENEAYPIEHRAYVAFQLIVHCRPQEMYALTWDDVDFDNDLLTINKRLQVVKDESGTRKCTQEVTPHTKTGPKGNRIVPAGSVLLPLLRELKKQRLAAGKMKSNLVFCHHDGGFLYKMRARRLWVAIQKSMALTEGQFYWLKTAGNTYALENGASVAAQASRMGHTTATMALTNYFKPGVKAMREAVEVFNRKKQLQPTG